MSTEDQRPPADGGINPYLQPGYQAPNPYQQGTAPLPQVGGMPPHEGKATSGGHHTLKMSLAAAASVLMIAGTTFGGYQLVLNEDDSPPPVAAPQDEDDTDDEPGDEEPGDDEPDDEDDTDDEDDDPRRGGEPVDTVVEGWQTQVEYARDIAWDVPQEEWRLETEGNLIGWDVDTGEVDEDGDPEYVSFLLSTPTLYMDGFCGVNTGRANAGTTGELGAVSTIEAAENSALQYVLAAYDHDQVGERTDYPAEEFSNDHGFEGHLARSTLDDLPEDEEDPECGSPSSEVIVISYVGPNGDLMSFLLVRDTGVDDQLDDDTVDQILGSLRHID